MFTNALSVCSQMNVGPSRCYKHCSYLTETRNRWTRLCLDFRLPTECWRTIGSLTFSLSVNKRVLISNAIVQPVATNSKQKPLVGLRGNCKNI